MNESWKGGTVLALDLAQMRLKTLFSQLPSHLKSSLGISGTTLAVAGLAIVGTLLSLGKSATVLTASKWDRSEIQVCFAEPKDKGDSRIRDDAKSFPEKARLVKIRDIEKQWIRSIIEQEYRKDRTYVSFVGWRDCDDRNPAAVWIYMGKGGPKGASNVGQDMITLHYIQVTNRNTGEAEQIIPVKERKPGQKPSYIFLHRMDSNELKQLMIDEETHLKLTALHEFGHATGLVHENEREGANTDGNCYLGRQSRQFQRHSENAVQYMSKYDPGSVMNYCFVFSVSTASGLKFDVAKPGLDTEKMPNQGLPILAWPGVLGVGPSRIASKTELNDRYRYEIRIGLSEGDVHTLRCFYGPQDAESLKTCNAETPIAL